MNKKKVFIIHGFEGQPNGGWRPYLMGALAKADIYACALPMPSPDAPSKDEWVEEIGRAVGAPDENIFLVGHSLGVPAIFQYLATLPEGKKIGGAVLVSGPIAKPEGNEYEAIKNFFEPDFDFEHIKKVCKNFVVIHGTDDPIVSYKDAEEISKRLSCKLISILNGKHLNGGAGVYELPEALNSLLSFQ